MVTLTIPDDLYADLLKVATQQHRTAEDLAIEGIAKVARPGHEERQSPLTPEEERRMVREAMKGRIWTEEDLEAYFEGLDLPPMSDEEAERIVASIPPLDPPLSQTIIEMRDEERY